ncbi:MAG TPA: hypothetical protein VGL71_11405 [Urbifossiella sp.]|jgi:hypothetical protein
MHDPELFDIYHVSLYFPSGTDKRSGDAARAALDELPFPEVLEKSVRTLFATIPSLASLAVTVDA